MKRFMNLLLASLVVMLLAPLCFAETRTYETNFGTMKLNFNGYYVSGTYTHQNGTIEGTFDADVLTGVWHQSNGKGAVIMNFTPDLSSFDARWSYAGESSWRGNWTGSQRGSGARYDAPPPAVSAYDSFKRSYNTDYGTMTLNFDGETVTGRYTHANGRIKGTLNGNILTGTWTQDNGSGAFRFEFGDDFETFQGKWNYKGERTMKSGWNGTPK